MKSQRRHELQQNSLADILTEKIDSVKPYFKSILGVIIALIALGFFGSMIMNQASEKNSTAWSDLYSAFSERDVDEFSRVASDHGDTAAGAWAEKTAADLDLEEGARLLYTDRELAQEALSRAEKGYLNVLKKASNQALLENRAHYGLAQAYECQSKVDLATKEYKAIVSNTPDSAFGKEAARRLKQIEQLSKEDWFTWFSEQKPVPRFNPTAPIPGLDPGSFPSFDNLRGKSDLTLPDLPEKTTDDKESDLPPAPPQEEAEKDPPEPSTEKASEKSGDDQPAEKKSDTAPKKSESPSQKSDDSEKK